MLGLSLVSWVILWALLIVMGLFALLVLGWQIMVLKGKAMKNPDGTVDDWHEQKTFYGMALADIFVACPTCLVGIGLVIAGSRWGYYLLAMAAFWFVWGNVMTTATSLKFEKPKITLSWFFTFPLGAVVGLAYIIWTVVHFDYIYVR
ncbi:MAG: hypothetical protein AB1664_06450 [Thermodesulfobacteriota bacterium]